MVKASDFKISRLVGFARAHHKIPRRRKEGRNPKLGEFPKIGFSLNIYAVAESIDFKFGTPVSYTHLTLPTKRIV